MGRAFASAAVEGDRFDVLTPSLLACIGRELVDRLVELGKTFDYMTYPNRNHGLSEGEGTALHVRMLMVRYLLEHLPAGPK